MKVGTGFVFWKKERLHCHIQIREIYTVNLNSSRLRFEPVSQAYKIQLFPYSLKSCLLSAAYKSADGKKIDGRRVLVDVERGRTVKGWKPRRLGGGLGSTRASVDGPNDRPMDRDRNK